MNTGGEGGAVVVRCAAHNSGVLRASPMQSLEGVAIMCGNGSAIRSCIGQDLSIAGRASAGLLYGTNVVTQRPQALDSGIIKVFVGVEPGHAFSGLGIAADKRIDLVGWLAAYSHAASKSPAVSPGRLSRMLESDQPRRRRSTNPHTLMPVSRMQPSTP